MKVLQDGVLIDAPADAVAQAAAAASAYAAQTPAMLASAMAMAVDHQIETGYAGKRVSLYGYFAQLNAYASLRPLTTDEAADRTTLLAAAVWEQDVIDAGAAAVAAGTLPSAVVWPPAPPALAPLAAAS